MMANDSGGNEGEERQRRFPPVDLTILKTVKSYPAGFRFCPTDDELVGIYLKKKAENQPLPLINPIMSVDVYKFNPRELAENWKELAEVQEGKLYFFTPRNRKYEHGRRPDRAAGDGFWKATGADKKITATATGEEIGTKKTLVFYEKTDDKPKKTNWIMQEYRLKDAPPCLCTQDKMKLDDVVLVKIYPTTSTAGRKRKCRDPPSDEEAEAEAEAEAADKGAYCQNAVQNDDADDASVAVAATANTGAASGYAGMSNLYTQMAHQVPQSNGYSHLTSQDVAQNNTCVDTGYVDYVSAMAAATANTRAASGYADMSSQYMQMAHQIPQSNGYAQMISQDVVRNGAYAGADYTDYASIMAPATDNTGVPSGYGDMSSQYTQMVNQVPQSNGYTQLISQDFVQNGTYVDSGYTDYASVMATATTNNDATSRYADMSSQHTQTPHQVPQSNGYAQLISQDYEGAGFMDYTSVPATATANTGAASGCADMSSHYMQMADQVPQSNGYTQLISQDTIQNGTYIGVGYTDYASTMAAATANTCTASGYADMSSQYTQMPHQAPQFNAHACPDSNGAASGYANMLRQYTQTPHQVPQFNRCVHLNNIHAAFGYADMSSQYTQMAQQVPLSDGYVFPYDLLQGQSYIPQNGSGLASMGMPDASSVVQNAALAMLPMQWLENATAPQYSSEQIDSFEDPYIDQIKEKIDSMGLFNFDAAASLGAHCNVFEDTSCRERPTFRTTPIQSDATGRV